MSATDDSPHAGDGNTPDNATCATDSRSGPTVEASVDLESGARNMHTYVYRPSQTQIERSRQRREEAAKSLEAAQSAASDRQRASWPKRPSPGASMSNNYSNNSNNSNNGSNNDMHSDVPPNINNHDAFPVLGEVTNGNRDSVGDANDSTSSTARLSGGRMSRGAVQAARVREADIEWGNGTRGAWGADSTPRSGGAVGSTSATTSSTNEEQQNNRMRTLGGSRPRNLAASWRKLPPMESSAGGPVPSATTTDGKADDDKVNVEEVEVNVEVDAAKDAAATSSTVPVASSSDSR